MFLWNAIALAIGALMDAVIGDPHNMVHMVMIFGVVISMW